MIYIKAAFKKSNVNNDTEPSDDLITAINIGDLAVITRELIEKPIINMEATYDN